MHPRNHFIDELIFETTNAIEIFDFWINFEISFMSLEKLSNTTFDD